MVIGGTLIQPGVAHKLLSFDLPLIDTGIDSVGEMALGFVGVFYIIAALFNLRVPDTSYNFV